MSEENDPKKNIKVSIDTRRTEELARQNERLLMEKEAWELSEEDLQLKIEQANEKFHTTMFSQATSKDMLSAMLTNYINEIADKAKGTPSGSPLVAQQYGIKSGEDLYTRKFYDSQSMISELRRLSHEGNPEEKAQAEQYIQEIFRKFVLDKRSAPTRPEGSHNPSNPENLTELDLVQKDGFLVPRNKEDGDLGKLQKKWREERKRRMEGKSE